MNNILNKLSGGDRRSIGKVNEVVAEVLRNPEIFGQLISGMQNNDPVIRMRAADAAEKVSQVNPLLLQAHKKILLNDISKISQQEVCWHLAQIFLRLKLSRNETLRTFEILLGFLNHTSKIVVTLSLQAMADFAEKNPVIRSRVIEILKEQIQRGSPAIKTRARVLLKKLAG
ncbi:MAG: hypothetical protein A2Y94_08400 [Caldithrix sp. RBG_13_44_9]|nr:MAG: hypothetical protein A2Y94_08400 [Caldithrix sp. RBG_13_44_9]